MELIDTHAHLDDRAYAGDRAAVIARAYAEGIGVITVGVDLRSSEEAVGLARRHRTIWAAVGVHPHGAKAYDRRVEAGLNGLAEEEKVVAIGEIGLDYYHDLSPRPVQRDAFAAQIELANELSLPVIIHNRESTKDLVAVLRAHPPAHGGVIHSFLGDFALAAELISLGLHLGIGGPLTFEKNDLLRRAVAEIPLERILIETDSPYLTPVPHRGRRNEPSYVRYVAEEIARIKGVSYEEVAAVTTANALRLFSLGEGAVRGSGS